MSVTRDRISEVVRKSLGQGHITGLPDALIFDGDGAVSEETFRPCFGFSRDSARRCLADLRTLMVKETGYKMPKDLDNCLAAFMAHSKIRAAFRNSTDKELPGFYLERFVLFVFFNQSIESKHDLSELFNLGEENVGLNTNVIGEDLLEACATFTDLTPTEQVKLANAIWGFASLTGKSEFLDLVLNDNRFGIFFSWIRDICSADSKNLDSVKTADFNHSDDTWGGLCSEVGQWVIAAKEKPSKEHLEILGSLVERLNRLDLLVMPSPERVKALIADLKDVVIQVISVCVAYFEQDIVPLESTGIGWVGRWVHLASQNSSRKELRHEFETFAERLTHFMNDAIAIAEQLKKARGRIGQITGSDRDSVKARRDQQDLITNLERDLEDKLHFDVADVVTIAGYCADITRPPELSFQQYKLLEGLLEECRDMAIAARGNDGGIVVAAATDVDVGSDEAPVDSRSNNANPKAHRGQHGVNNAEGHGSTSSLETEKVEVVEVDEIAHAVEISAVDALTDVDGGVETVELEVLDQSGGELADPEQDQVEEFKSDHNHLMGDADEIKKVFAYEIEVSKELSHYTIDSASACYVSAGYLNAAYWVSEAAEKTQRLNDFNIPAALYRAAFFGMNVWGDNRKGNETAINASYRYLLDLDQVAIPDAGPSAKLASSLLFVASLQSALFGGSSIPIAASRLRDSVQHQFNVGFRETIDELVKLSKQGVSLRNQDLARRESTREDDIKDIQRDLQNWESRNLGSVTGWWPLRKVVRNCIEQSDGAFHRVCKAIRDDRESDNQLVRDFLDDYYEDDQIMVLLGSMLSSPEINISFSDARTSARVDFGRTTRALQEIAQRWLRVVHSKRQDGAEIERFSSRFMAQARALTEDIKVRLSQNDLAAEDRAGLVLVLGGMDNLLRVVKGETALIWSPQRAAAWMDLPRDIFAGSGDPGDYDQLLSGLIDALPTLVPSDLVVKSLENNHFSHARLLIDTKLQEHPRHSEWQDLAEKGFVVQLDQVKNILLGTRRKLDAARQSDAVDGEYAGLLLHDIEYIEHAINEADLYRDYRKDVQKLEDLQSELDQESSERLNIIDARITSARKMLFGKLGADSIDPSWLVTLERATQDRNIPILEELATQLEDSAIQGEPVESAADYRNETLKAWLLAEKNILEEVSNHTNPPDIRRKVNTGCLGDITFDPQKNQALAAIAEFMITQSKGRPLRKQESKRREGPELDQRDYHNIVKILEFIGLRPINKVAYPSHNGESSLSVKDLFVSLSLKVDAANAGTPYPDFGSMQGNEIGLVAVGKKPELRGLDEHMQYSNLAGKIVIVLYFIPMTPKERLEFADYWKRKKPAKPVIALDLPMIMFLADMRWAGLSAIVGFLRLALPYTYYNPFSEDLKPPAREMRFGRKQEEEELLDFERGAAIVFGGRQLGKSTILTSVAERVKTLGAQCYGYYIVVDSLVKTATMLDRSGGNQVRALVLQSIYRSMMHDGLVPKVADPDLLTEEKIGAALRDAFVRNKELKVLCALDEVDVLLNFDALHGFLLCRELRTIKYETNNRFKVVMAGLHDVQRFSDISNQPVNQLGGSRVIGILPVSDAITMIKQPIQAMGYNFNSDMQITDILSRTNCHPGVLQVAGHQLLKRLADRKAWIGDGIINDQDISNLFDDATVKEATLSRFESTLNLDKKYLIIVYSLVIGGLADREFTVREAKGIAADWVPIARTMSDTEFSNLLTELVGLGVLRKDTANGKAPVFALRNYNVLRLLGDKDSIEDKLLTAVEVLTNDHPRDAHQIEIQGERWMSPLTLNNELDLLRLRTQPNGEGLREKSKKETKEPSRYSVTIVAGSRALGIDSLVDGFKKLNRTEELSSSYRVIRLDVSEGTTPAALLRKLESVREFVKTTPCVLMVSFAGAHSVSQIVQLLRTAQGFELKGKDPKPLRVVFALGPLALWSWVVGQENTDAFESTLAIIYLQRWQQYAIQELLSACEENHTPSHVKAVQEATGGWPIELKRTILDKSARGDTSLPDSGARMTKERQRILDALGVSAMPWVAKLLQDLAQEGSLITVEIVEMYLEMLADECQEVPSRLQASAVITWFVRMQFIQEVKRQDQRGTGKKTEIYYEFSPKVLSWVGEMQTDAA